MMKTGVVWHYELDSKEWGGALAGVAQWIEHSL